MGHKSHFKECKMQEKMTGFVLGWVRSCFQAYSSFPFVKGHGLDHDPLQDTNIGWLLTRKNVVLLIIQGVTPLFCKHWNRGSIYPASSCMTCKIKLEKSLPSPFIINLISTCEHDFDVHPSPRYCNMGLGYLPVSQKWPYLSVKAANLLQHGWSPKIFRGPARNFTKNTYCFRLLHIKEITPSIDLAISITTLINSPRLFLLRIVKI